MPAFIREWREYKGLTLQQLADRLNRPLPSMSRMERDPQHIKIEDLEQIALSLDCQPSDLFKRP